MVRGLDLQTPTDEWPIRVYGAAQDPDLGGVQCGRCYDTFWSCESRASLGEIRAAIDGHRQVCTGDDDAK